MQIVADMHTHTLVSGHAYSTWSENLQAASQRGLKYMATTEHGPAMPGGPHPYYFSNMRILPEELAGVRLLRGVEANIMNRQGELDLAERFLARLDYVAVGLHDDCLPPGSVEENTDAVLHAMTNPLVDTIVHPGNPKYPLDYERVVAASIEYGVLLEINNSSLVGSRRGSYEPCSNIARLACRAEALVVLGSDAHWAGQVGVLDRALALALDAGIQERKILNLSEEAIAQFLAMRREAKQQGKRVRFR